MKRNSQQRNRKCKEPNGNFTERIRKGPCAQSACDLIGRIRNV